MTTSWRRKKKKKKKMKKKMMMMREYNDKASRDNYWPSHCQLRMRKCKNCVSTARRTVCDGVHKQRGAANSQLSLLII
ncbi:hypothetical protein T4E_2331 [Trichinella pseudospiralis]|uniref:Uncharacterized protein n=1 Tax=Trichinella pseudospiralis TaxID=6337 RepID=A0A0V0Y2R3_TRIPS|nr:hypothetical protein T4E_2331 [Trichinella pseudospiralis]